MEVPWDRVLFSCAAASLDVVPLSLRCDVAVVLAMVDDDDCGLKSWCASDPKVKVL